MSTAKRLVTAAAAAKNSAGYLMVNNDPILWTMLNAIKEQQKEIAGLKGQVQKLRAAAHRRQSQALERLRQTVGRSFRRPAGVGNRGEKL